MMQVISIQSQVVHGHVGNSAAVFPMQARGVPVAVVPTALLSNHPHYPTIYGHVLDAGWVADLLRGVEDRGLIGPETIILSGYLGSAANAEAVAAFVERARAQFPDIRYVCDPVMGDSDVGLFVVPELTSLFRDRLVPLASAITPNIYELGLLTGREIHSVDEVQNAGRSLMARGTGSVIVTGCELDDTPEGGVETILIDDGNGDDGLCLHRTVVDRLPIRPCGTGDLFTALLVAQWCKGAALVDACHSATHDIHAILCRTEAAGAREMAIIGWDGW